MFEYNLIKPVENLGIEQKSIFIVEPNSLMEEALDVLQSVYAKGVFSVSKGSSNNSNEKSDPEKAFNDYQDEQERLKNISDKQLEFENKEKINGLSLIFSVCGELKKAKDAFKSILTNQQCTFYDRNKQQKINQGFVSDLAPKDFNNLMYGYFNYFLEL